MSQYKTILGAASSIDKEERPYVVMSIAPDGGMDVSSCVQDGSQQFGMATAMIEHLGFYMMQESMPASVREAIHAQGFTEDETAYIIGISGLMSATLGSNNAPLKKYLAKMLGTIIEQLVVKDQSLAEAAASLHKASSEETH